MRLRSPSVCPKTAFDDLKGHTLGIRNYGTTLKPYRICPKPDITE